MKTLIARNKCLFIISLDNIFFSAGFYCAAPGVTDSTGPCDAGYYCLGGAITATPVNDTTGSYCLAGYYCPEGSASPQVNFLVYDMSETGY